MGRLDTNGARMAPGQNLWTPSHAGCFTPWQLCGAEYTVQMGSPTLVKYYCGKEKVMSYVDSSRYESETPLQEAERKLHEYKEMVDATRRRIEKLKKETRFGEQPSNGSMVKIEKWYNGFRGGSRYYYGAIRIDSKWYMTCSNGYQKTPMSWDELKTFIGDSKFWVAGSFKEAPAA